MPVKFARSYIRKRFHQIARKLEGVPEDKHLSFIKSYHFPELRTIASAPQEAAPELRAKFDHRSQQLEFYLQGTHYICVFKPEDIVILSSQPFEKDTVRAQLQNLRVTQHQKKNQNSTSSPILPSA